MHNSAAQTKGKEAINYYFASNGRTSVSLMISVLVVLDADCPIKLWVDHAEVRDTDIALYLIRIIISKVFRVIISRRQSWWWKWLTLGISIEIICVLIKTRAF